MSLPLISVIIPIYNTELYIKRCLDSIISQTYQNLEIICINDGSTDKSNEILLNYTQIDTRIKVVSQENAGVSAARNLGLDMSHGDYISFIDSDDYIAPNMYEVMIQNTRLGTAICVCQWREVDNEIVIIPKGADSESKTVIQSPSEFEYRLYSGQYNNVMVCSPCNKLYPRHAIGFRRFQSPWAEDEEFNDRIIASWEGSIIVIPNVLYYYCHNSSSLTHSQFSVKNLIFFDILIQRIRLFNNDKIIILQTRKLFCNIYVEYYYRCKQISLIIPSVYKKKFFKMFYSLCTSRACNFKFIVRMVLFSVSPSLYKTLSMHWKK